jgi:hypothetical protein
MNDNGGVEIVSLRSEVLKISVANAPSTGVPKVEITIGPIKKMKQFYVFHRYH